MYKTAVLSPTLCPQTCPVNFTPSGVNPDKFFRLQVKLVCNNLTCGGL